MIKCMFRTDLSSFFELPSETAMFTFGELHAPGRLVSLFKDKEITLS